jgi:uncharacterized protein (DUF3820 family)
MSEYLAYPDYVFTFGKHKGTRIDAVPASYLIWLAAQAFPPADVVEYVRHNRRLLRMELAKEETGRLRDELSEYDAYAMQEVHERD